MSEQNPMFPTQLSVEITEQMVRAYVKENLSDFLDFMFPAYDFTMWSYISEREEDFWEFVLSGGTQEEG